MTGGGASKQTFGAKAVAAWVAKAAEPTAVSGYLNPLLSPCSPLGQFLSTRRDWQPRDGYDLVTGVFLLGAAITCAS